MTSLEKSIKKSFILRSNSDYKEEEEVDYSKISWEEKRRIIKELDEKGVLLEIPLHEIEEFLGIEPYLTEKEAIYQERMRKKEMKRFIKQSKQNKRLVDKFLSKKRGVL